MLCFLFSPSKHINKRLPLSFHSLCILDKVIHNSLTSQTLPHSRNSAVFYNSLTFLAKKRETNEHQKENFALTAANTNNNTHSQIFRTTTIKPTTIQPKRMNSNKKLAAVRIYTKNCVQRTKYTRNESASEKKFASKNSFGRFG